MTVYINGSKASKFDLEKLWQDVKNGKQKITVNKTRAGALSVKTLL